MNKLCHNFLNIEINLYTFGLSFHTALNPVVNEIPRHAVISVLLIVL
jgi:hypothetical protein